MSSLSSRILKLNDVKAPEGCSSVVYVMSRDQRVQDNHALLAAQQVALEQKLPLIVVFNLYAKSRHRSQEQFAFMLEGLHEVEQNLTELGIGFALNIAQSKEAIAEMLLSLRPAAVYFDFNPLRGPRAHQKYWAGEMNCPTYVVDTHNVIPLWVLSDKEEFAAHTIRNKVHKNLEQWLVEPEQLQAMPAELHWADSEIATNVENADWAAAGAHIQTLPSSGAVHIWTSGEAAARKALDDFIANRLARYGDDRNIPLVDGQSNMSPYLHFGHISALRIAHEVIAKMSRPPLLFVKGKLASYEGEATFDDSADAFIEELIVRKELADNYCFYQADYDKMSGARQWGIDTVEAHRADERDYVYDLKTWQAADTHDPSWNAAQRELMKTGKLHGYMRMYWAKKILEWSASPEEALETAIYLNDFYSIDGGDPNGYTGIMWSLFGIHDRPWFERPVYGKIRYMNEGGLARRFNLEEYAKTNL